MAGESFRRTRPTSQWAHLSRSSCSECGAPIKWGTAQDLAWEVAPGERVRIFAAIDHAGAGADAWRCTQCDGWGIFARDEIVWL